MGCCSYTEAISLANPTPTPGSVQASQTNGEESRYYVEQIKAMKDYELTTLYVDMLHLLEREEVLARAIRGQYYRFVKGFRMMNDNDTGVDSHHCMACLDSCRTSDELYRLSYEDTLLLTFTYLVPSIPAQPVEVAQARAPIRRWSPETSTLPSTICLWSTLSAISRWIKLVS